ncbi:MFS transporter [Terrarubrum flagellatum]|uniref:MFS transporter n=1 Tax=Terrirubrum flagellatum TaxID=2895980 RepID=UPI0031452BE4
MINAKQRERFYGWTVVAAAFIIAIFGWGVGFYGPPIYLKAAQDARQWSVTFVSSAVTLHFLIGAVVVANLPRLHRRFGLPGVTIAGALSLALGVLGWSLASEKWMLIIAAILTGVGWVPLGAAAINAMVSPWFVAKRPAALAMAYNGASVGGVLFSPLWALLIGSIGFSSAAIIVGVAMLIIVGALSLRILTRTPTSMGLAPDGGDAASAAARKSMSDHAPEKLFADYAFVTLAAGMAIGLFAQIGLIAHLFSLLTPALGAQFAGVAAGLATASAILGRTIVGWLMPADADRRLIAGANLGVQMLGCAAFLLAGGGNIPLLFAGVILFGFGIGNSTSLPPLIAQAEFAPKITPRVVALTTACSQATYAFAPAAFGLLRDLSAGDATLVFIAAALIQALGATAYLAGRRRAAPISAAATLD